MANSWTTTTIIINEDKWSSVMNVLERQVGLEKYAALGGWNDPSVLWTGGKGLTRNEQYVQFALWCILKAPLIIASDLTLLSPEAIDILSNE